MNLSRPVQWSWQYFAKRISQCLILADPVSLPQMSKDSAQSALSSRSLKSSHRAGSSLPMPAFLQVQSSWHSLPVALGDPRAGSLGLVPDRGQPSGSQG